MSTAGTETLLNADSPYTSNGTPRSRHSPGQFTPDHPVPSSPILKDLDSTPSRLVVPHNASERTSRASSIRLSRDLGSLRWDGNALDVSDINEDSIFEGDEEADEGESTEPTNGLDKSAADNQDTPREETGQLNSYSALSKRADFILASAKRKLNLLEGDIKGARHSLMLPSLSSQSQSSTFTPGGRPSAPRLTDDEANKNNRGPRINFGTPRSARASPDDQRGHARVFSETSVPSPRGTAVKGSLSLAHVRNQHPLHRSSVDRSLGPVIEGQVSTDYSEGGTQETRREASSPINRSSTTQILRSEADDVRDRLAHIQERLQSDADKRRFKRDSEVISQIKALEMSLEQQEQVIDQLERAEETDETDQAVEHNPRAEWQQILDHSDGQEDGYGSSDEYDDDAEFQSVLEEQQYDETELDVDGAHEDRVDAFDYEHFILHSVLGNLGPQRRWSTGSASSTSTARGPADQDPDSNQNQLDRRARKQLHHNESIASFATAHSHASDEDDDFKSDNSEPAPETADSGLARDWPMPPSTNGSRQASTLFSDESDPAPPAHGHGSGHRPASRIFSALMGPESQFPAWPDLDDEDQTLVYALAEALRTACLQLRRNTLDKQVDVGVGVDWRQRVEEARKVLVGEQEAASSL